MLKIAPARFAWLTAAIAIVGGFSFAARVEHSRGQIIRSRVRAIAPLGWRLQESKRVAMTPRRNFRPAVQVPFGPHSLFAPFQRRDVLAVISHWRSVPPVVVRPGDLAYSTRYNHWKSRAQAFINALNDEGRSDAARADQAWLEAYERSQADPAAPAPRPAPSDLVASAGGEPPAAFRGVQNTYTVALPFVAGRFTFVDHPVDPDYPYLLDPSGVADEGTPVFTRADVSHVMRAAGLNHDQRVVFRKVSEKEGGFEAINTYDTGYVSVGFIQFAAMRGGNGSLARVLERMKTDNLAEYRHYFEKFGVDVDENRCLCVIDPSTARVLHGADAVDAIRRDKRLTAVFYHAGAGSPGFQQAQIAMALDEYYAPSHSFRVAAAEVVDYSDPAHPARTYYYGDDAVASAQASAASRNARPWNPPAPVRPVAAETAQAPQVASTSAVDAPQSQLSVPADTGAATPSAPVRRQGPRCQFVRLPDLAGQYGDVFRSEAGKTAITDRCVQHGYDIGPTQEGLRAKLVEAIDQVAGGQRMTVADLAARERDLIPIVQNRILVLADSDLGQPGPSPRLARALTPKRNGPD